LKWEGITYGNVRNLMEKQGVLGMFSSGKIVDPVASAVPIINALRKYDVLEDKSRGWQYFESEEGMELLVKEFMRFTGIKGCDIKSILQDKSMTNGFARSFLEYFQHMVIPQWNKVEEQLFSMRDLDEKSGEYKKEKTKADKLVMSLMMMFGHNQLLRFMADHIKFPNMKMVLIDYGNARGYE
jgi:hypothetical protein